MASVLLTLTLVPALRLMRDGMKVGRQIEIAGIINSYSIAEIERNMVLGAADWSTGTVQGDFTARGFPNLRYEVIRSDSLAAGGIADRLMTITATVWEDNNGNNSWDTGEYRVVYATKIAKMSGYQEGVGG